MNTSELIDAIAADRPEPGLSMGARFGLALGAGLLVSACLFLVLVGPRPDIAVAAQTPRFILKIVDSIGLALPSILFAFRVLRPDASLDALAWGFSAPFLLLLGAVIAELAVVPAAEWRARLVGSNSLHCLTVIPLLSIAPLTGLILAMRYGAPRNGAIAGALAGAAAAGLSAMLYATNCPDDSPLFVATWYPAATLIVAGVGAFAGSRLLRW